VEDLVTATGELHGMIPLESNHGLSAGGSKAACDENDQ
jgi:hypothetical protein